MTPTQLIENLDGLLSAVRSRVDDLDAEARAIGNEWALLGRIGGQRDDHAAQLLTRLQVHLAEITHFVSRCDSQIQSLSEQPFGPPTARSTIGYVQEPTR